MRSHLLFPLVLLSCAAPSVSSLSEPPEEGSDNQPSPSLLPPSPVPSAPRNHPASFQRDFPLFSSSSMLDTGMKACGKNEVRRCALAESCTEHSDCLSETCDYSGKCIFDKSCTQHFGGDTCGIGETGSPDAKHGSCCETAPLFGNHSNVQMDRWLITAGRMRSFIERVNGDVRSFVHTLPANVWQSSYDQYVPSSLAEADVQLGSYFDKKSCHPGDHTGRTWYVPPTPDDYSDFTKDQLDEKALNCVSWHLAKALCLFDGKRLASGEEIKNAFTEDGKYIQPWLWQPNAVQYVQPALYEENTPATTTFNHAFGYGYPETNVRSDPQLDIAYHISPPGRYPQSWNEHGHEIAGNLLTWNNDGPFIFSATYSWENHGGDSVADSDWAEFEATAGEPHEPNGYYAIGARCVRD